MSPKADKCQHPPCSCTVADGSKYCGPYCEGAKDTPEIKCECEHAGCAGHID